MDENSKRLLKIEACVVTLTLIFMIFVSFNSSMKVMKGPCEDSVNRGVSCEYETSAPRITTPILD